MKLQLTIKCSVLMCLLPLMLINLTEEQSHEYLAVFFGLLALCHLYSVKWWFSLKTSNKFHTRLKIRSFLAIALLLSLVLTCGSGILISRYAVPFLRSPWGQRLLIDIHFCSAFWCFCLLLIHVGAELSENLNYLFLRFKNYFLINCIGLSLIFYGVIQLQNNPIHLYLIHARNYVFFDALRPEWLHLIDIASIGTIFIFIGFVLKGFCLNHKLGPIEC